jgi:hypothetical protein
VESLISQVSDGTIDYAIVAANEADIARSAYSERRARFLGRRQARAGMGRFPRRRRRSATRSTRFSHSSGRTARCLA